MVQYSNEKAARKSGTSLRSGLIDFVLVPTLVALAVHWLLPGAVGVALKPTIMFAWRKRTEIWAFIKPWLNDDGPPGPLGGAPALAMG